MTPLHRPLSNPYSLVFVLATGAFLYSTQVGAGAAQYIWFSAAAGILFLPFIMMRFQQAAQPEHVEQAQRIRPSLVERFGLLTIILLGENLISIVGGATYIDNPSLESLLPVGISILIVFSLWWVYFDFVSARIPVQTIGKRMSWMYFHLPMTMSIGLVAVGLLNVIEYVKEFTVIDRWFVVGPVALFLFSTALISTTLQLKFESNREVYRQTMFAAVLSGLLLVAIGFTQLSIVMTLAVTWLLLTIPGFTGFKLWVKRQYEESLRNQVS